MANPTVNLTWATPDPDFCPSTFTEAVKGNGGLEDLVTGSLSGTFVPYVQGSTTPAVDDQDKIWQRVDAQGRPIGTYKYYSGNWRRVYTHPLGTIVMFNGDPSGLFDGTGLGVVSTEWDGWALANGNNGTPNLSDKFIVGARMDNVGISQYDSGWQTNVGGIAAKTGGAATVTLDSTNTYRPSRASIVVGAWSADGNAPGTTSGGLFGVYHPEVADNAVELLAADGGNATPAPISILPPYYSLAYSVFVGYS